VAKPVTVTVRPSMIAPAQRTLVRVSVVRIARAASARP